MSIYHSPYFGEIDLSDTQYYYNEIKILLKERIVTIDLNIDNAQNMPPEPFQEVDQYISDITSHEKNMRELLVNNAKASQVTDTNEYIDIYKNDPLIQERLKYTDPTLSPEARVFSLIYLKRIGFYPEHEEVRSKFDSSAFVVFDYTLGEEITNYLLVVKVRKDKTTYITTES